jgi:hypothetical protein
MEAAVAYFKVLSRTQAVSSSTMRYTVLQRKQLHWTTVLVREICKTVKADQIVFVRCKKAMLSYEFHQRAA